MKGNFLLNGFAFEDHSEYEKAKKEWEAITYMRDNTDLTNTELVLKIYNKFVDKLTFQTVIGFDFLKELQEIIKQDTSISEEDIKAIPVKGKDISKPAVKEINPAMEDRQSEKYKKLYEQEKAGKKTLKIVIAALAVIIIAMFGVVQFTPYTLFSDYENKIIDKYEYWQEQLTEKEKLLNQREKELSDREAAFDKEDKAIKE